MTPQASAQSSSAQSPLEPIDDSRLMSHSYDGIQEYDNPLPGWWRFIFWASIFFAIGYGLYYHVAGWGATPDDNYKSALADYRSKKSMRDALEASLVSEEILTSNGKNANVLEHGAAVFAARCVSCHTDNGRGLIGPNLTDLFQIHGTSRMDIYRTIHDGVSGTAMLAWGEQLPAGDVVSVASFVATLRGKNITGKEPQGQKVEPFTP